MLLDIDLNDGAPIYEQIASGVRAALSSGRLREGDRLPAGRELAGALGVNLETVQRAYRLLADEGLVISRVGRGTRVADNIDTDQMELNQHIVDLVARAAAIGVSVRELAAMIRSSPEANPNTASRLAAQRHLAR
jgi:GntR family transcriptional regulator